MPSDNPIQNTVSPETAMPTVNTQEVPVVAMPEQGSVQEANVVSEQLPTQQPAADPVQNQTVVAEQPVVTPQPAINMAKPDDTSEAKPLDDRGKFSGEGVYLREAKKVMKEDADEPYKEEENAESIQVDYMEKRFGVKLKREDE